MDERLADFARQLPFPLCLPDLLKAAEYALIDQAMYAGDGSPKRAADLLGLKRTTLVEKLRRRDRPRTRSF